MADADDLPHERISNADLRADAQGRLTVFISSTSRYFQDHRKVVEEACLRMGLFPLMMEHFTAVDDPPLQLCLEMVEQADLFIGIVGQRYGYIPPENQFSITELEHQHAAARKLPMLLFLSGGEATQPVLTPEPSVSLAALTRFRSALMTEYQKTIAFYISPEDLRSKVITALVPYKHKQAVHGLPSPPFPYRFHPYSLLQRQAKLGWTHVVVIPWKRFYI